MYIEKFLIHELADRAKTTIRTIRYYTDEGLLPQPVLHGKYAYYTPAHLNRLELIRRMKDAYLPLREIRQIMISLSDDEVKLRLEDKLTTEPKIEMDASPDQPSKNSGSKALEYISQLLDQQALHRPQENISMIAAPKSTRVGETSPSSVTLAPAVNKPSPDGESWQRISLASGVELNVREPVNQNDANRIHQLISFAKKLFR